MERKLNLKACIFWAILITIIVVAILYFAGVQPVRGALDWTFSSITAWISGILGEDVSTAIGNYLQQNWITVATMIPTVIGLGITYLRLRGEQSLNKKLEDANKESAIKQMNLETQAKVDETTIQELEGRITKLTLDDPKGELQTTIKTLTGKCQRAEQQYANLETSVGQIFKSLAEGAEEVKDPISGEIVKIVRVVEKKVI